MNRALVDADIILYEFGNVKKDDGVTPLPWPFIVSRVDARIINICESVAADSHTLYLTGSGNYREHTATIVPYKGNRPSEKPYWHQHIKRFLIEHRDAVLVEGMEADDALGIEQCRYPDDTVICSRDKDLNMIPGWHYSWSAGNQKEKPMWYIGELDALKSFYSQLLTGDSTDNIPGLYGVGKSSKLLDTIRSSSDELEMYLFVKQEYIKRFGSYWELFITENARLLWICRELNEDIRQRFLNLEKRIVNNETVSF